ncbi:MAG: hypothetical protein GY829_06890 [Gammaproteobacteria bacterium]|nr:hypothetical protein [Gammaproteobacteria bacterium]
MKFVKVSIKQITLLVLFSLSSLVFLAEDELPALEYIPIEPVIVTNYQKKSMKKPGFIQLKAQLSVRGKESADVIVAHMPLIRDHIIDFLSFTNEKTIKDASHRNQLRESLTKGIQDMLTEQLGAPLVEELIITHFMWD